MMYIFNIICLFYAYSIVDLSYYYLNYGFTYRVYNLFIIYILILVLNANNILLTLSTLPRNQINGPTDIRK